TEMFQFTAFTLNKAMYSLRLSYSIKNKGFPHSEISGSLLTYSSPDHIGVRPVLLRLLVPRHQPCALIHLTCRLKVLLYLLFFLFCIALFTINRLYNSRCCFYIIINKLTFVSNQLISMQRTTSEGINPSKLNIVIRMCKVPYALMALSLER